MVYALSISMITQLTREVMKMISEYYTEKIKVAADNGDMMEVIEHIVDATDVQSVLEMLASVCHHKAEHIRAEWQDEEAALLWDEDAESIRDFALTV
jgi:hypothetical protein